MIDCPSCGHPNRDGAKFCGACAASLALVIPCPSCGAPNPEGQRFCDKCAHELLPTAGAPAVPNAIAGGRYELLRLIGESSRRRVHLARDTRLDRDVAVSILNTAGLDEMEVARARREARAMGRLGEHPHIVTVYDSGEEDGRPYVVMQHMGGGTLAELLARSPGPGIDPDEAARIADEICRALEYAHRRGFVHRELSPAGVWLGRDGSIKLGDFALAAAVDRSRRDPRLNLYELGVVLYELVTGRRPGSPPTPPSEQDVELHPAFEKVILDLLEPSPEHRPGSAAAVREQLAEVLPAAQVAEQAAAEEIEEGLGRLGGVFVGRERELGQLRAAVEDACAGRGRVIMLTGEPGIGKTRIADELAVHATRRGAQVLWGRCYEGEGAPAYWPWVQVVRAYVWSRDSDALAAAMGTGAADIGQLVSDVRERLPGVPEPPPTEPDQARFRLFDAITAFLKNAAAAQPVVVILDDLHWADKPSLLLLEFLAREAANSSLVVLGTYREVELDPRHPLHQILAELRRDRMFERVELEGLAPGDVRALLEATSDEELGPDALRLAEVVDRETEGNPFFIREVLRHLQESGAIRRSGGRWESAESTIEGLGLPAGVREVIDRRLARLSPECEQVLMVGAVIGRNFGLDALEHTAGLPTDRLLEALEEALAAHVIEEVPERPGRYSFSHTLVRETIYEQLTGTRRVRYHRIIAEALEELYAGSVERHLPELAYHFREAALAGEIERAVEYTTRAGDHAAQLLAYEEAAGHYERALEVLDRAQAPDQPRRCDLLIALGEARTRAGDTAQARTSFQHAATIARELQSADRLARAALGFGTGLGGWGYTGLPDEALINLLDEALAALPGGENELRVRLMSRLAVELYYTPYVERRAEMSRQAVAMAQRLGGSEIQLVAQCGRHWAMVGPDGIDERIAAAKEIVRLADEAGDREMAFRGHQFHLATMLELGELEAVDAEIETCRALAEDLRQPIYLWQAAAFRAMRALMDGRLEEAERGGQDAFNIGRRGQAEVAAVLLGVQLLFLRSLQGRLDELERPIRDFVNAYPASSFRPSLAFVLTELDRMDEARAEFDAMAEGDFRKIHREGNWIISMAVLAMVSVALADHPRSAILYELLTPYAERLVVGNAGALCMAPVAHFLGMLAASLGRFEEAEAHFEAAMATGRRVQAPVFVAWTSYESGLALLARDGPEDRARGSALLTESFAESRELGMGRFVDRIRALDTASALRDRSP